MKKMISIICLMAVLSVGGISVSDAFAYIVLNIPGTYGQPNTEAPTYHFDLSAGNYLFELVSPATDSQASFWSWNPWSSGGHWNTYTWIMNGTTIYEIGGWTAQSTPEEGFWTSQANGWNATTFTLSADAHLRIGVCDGASSDNQGGVSVRLTQIPDPVPVPAAVCLLGSGLVGFAGIRVTRKK